MGPFHHARPSSALSRHHLGDLIPADQVDGADTLNCLIRSWGSVWQEGHVALLNEGVAKHQRGTFQRSVWQTGMGAGKQEEAPETNSKKSLWR